MAAAETDGVQRLHGTNHTPSVQAPGAETDEVGGREFNPETSLLQDVSQEIKTEDIKIEDQTVTTIDNSNLNSESNNTKPEEETASYGGNLALSASQSLDELMDIGTVDQEEQEARIKEEGDTMDMHTDVSQSPVLSNTGSSSPATLVNGTKEKVAQSAELDNSSFALVQVKDEPLDYEYDQAFTSTAALKDEDEPSAEKNDLQIGAVFSVPTASEKSASISPSPLHMSCFNCKKSLIKGQTAFQRKGSSAVYCSTACLTATLPTNKGGSTRVCHHCQKLICRPQDVIFCPDANGIMMDFCSHNCLNAFKQKKNSSIKIQPSTSARPTGPLQTLCSMCSRYCISKHEVTLSGIIHKLCSDNCFNHFRTSNKLTMAGCASCGSFFSSKPLMLMLDEGNKTVCNQECLSKFKEKNKSTPPCSMCRTTRPMSEMVENKNNDDTVNLFCSSSCVMAYKVQTVSTSGARLNCDTCGKTTLPSYHLAMSDTSIRNFCSLQCVMAFQEKFKKTSSLGNIFTKLPIGSHQPATPIAPQPQVEVIPGTIKLNCSQCAKKIMAKPEVIQIENKLVFLCGLDCSQEFKRVNYLVNVCDYCKVEKITKEAKRIGNKNCNFCSDGCKLLYRHDLTKSWGKHCQSCSYCHSVSKKMVTANYGNTVEEFCSDECRSKYTMLFCHVAKCDLCSRKGKLKQSLPLLGDTKHFCDLACLLKFCCSITQTQGEVVLKTATPVIANVRSLAGPADEKATTMIPTTSRPTQITPSKVLKNKALLCKPIVQNKGISCKTQTVDCEVQTDKTHPDMLIVPIPVPVYVPVPMAMYSQCTPLPTGLPLPLPVPMFLPVAMDNAEKIVETIQQIKEKIPSNPFEAELILMAEMVAEDSEDNPKQKTQERQTSKTYPPATDDRTSTYSDDLDTDDLATFLNNWEDTDPGLRMPSRPFAHEKIHPVVDIPVGTLNVPLSPPQHLSTPAMDLEEDLTIEMLERLFHLREQEARPPSPPPRHYRKAREKNKGRNSKRSKKGAEPVVPKATSQSAMTQKLKSEYGLDAWKHWVQWRQTQPNLPRPRIGSRPLDLKEDILKCTTAELSLGLCCFVSEIKRPNGEPYSPDSLYYICLGLQQHLFNNGRVENIFMDRFYSKFSADFTNKLRGFTPILMPSGYVHSRVEEEFLWDCKQLGAYSPIVLLNTLLFFCCKYFGFTTAEQHRQLSFAHVMRCTKTNPNNSKTTFLRFYPPVAFPANETEQEETPAKKRKPDEAKEEVLEMAENSENPLRCPVRLYEFYLSKCSESVKQRTNLFYLHPERSCVPNSPLWFSSTPLDDDTMEAMMIRILATRELHPKLDKPEEDLAPDDKPYIPEEEDDSA